MLLAKPGRQKFRRTTYIDCLESHLSLTSIVDIWGKPGMHNGFTLLLLFLSEYNEQGRCESQKGFVVNKQYVEKLERKQ